MTPRTGLWVRPQPGWIRGGSRLQPDVCPVGSAGDTSPCPNGSRLDRSPWGFAQVGRMGGIPTGSQLDPFGISQVRREPLHSNVGIPVGSRCSAPKGSAALLWRMSALPSTASLDLLGICPQRDPLGADIPQRVPAEILLDPNRFPAGRSARDPLGTCRIPPQSVSTLPTPSLP